MEQREVLTVHALSVLSCKPTTSLDKSKKKGGKKLSEESFQNVANDHNEVI